MSHQNRRSLWIALQIVFLASGLSGLGCQMIWTRQLGLELGHEAAAALAVVTAFFAGLAAGAWGLGPWVGTTPRPGRAYALLELVIALWMAASPSLLPAAARTGLHLLGLSPGPVRHWMLVFVAAFLMLLPATAAMGATFPALERFASQATGRSGTAGALYAANTAGAVLGVLLGAFVLIPALGFNASLRCLAGLPLLAALGTLALERAVRIPAPPACASDPGGAPGGQSVDRHPGGTRAGAHGGGGPELSSTRFVATAFATGLLGIGLEVLGMRLMAQVLENTVYSFAAILAVFLTGTAAGAALQRRWLPRRAGADRVSGLLTALAVATALCGWVLCSLPRLVRLMGGAAEAGWGALRFGDILSATWVFGVPALLMGATFSALAHAAGRQPGGLARLVSLNALGCACAPLVFNVLLVPTVGSRWSLTALVCTYAALAVPAAGLRTLLLAGAILGMLPLPSRLPPAVMVPGASVQTWAEGVTDTVAVLATPDGNRSLQVNNRYTMGGTASANAERRQAHLPLLMHPRPARALFLGTGTGITTGAALDHPGLEADGVELVPEVAAAMPAFAPANRLGEWPPRVRQHVADARRWVRSTTNRYDVVVADLFHPARDGAGALYTREHFAALRGCLAPGGVCCQWLPLYQLDGATLRIIVRTFLEVFPHTRAWLLRLNVDTPALGLIGAVEPRRYPADWLERRAASASLRDALKPLALTESPALFGLVLGDADALRRYAGDAPVSTDDRPLVTFTAPRAARARDAGPDDPLFALLGLLSVDPADLFESTERVGEVGARLAGYGAARNAYLSGLRLERDGKREEALSQYLESVRLSPDFSTGYAHCLTLAVQRSKEDPAAARRLLQRLQEWQPRRQAAQELLKRLGDNAPQ